MLQNDKYSRPPKAIWVDLQKPLTLRHYYTIQGIPKTSCQDLKWAPFIFQDVQEDTLLNQVLLLDSIDAIAIGSIGLTSIVATEDRFLKFAICIAKLSKEEENTYYSLFWIR